MVAHFQEVVGSLRGFEFNVLTMLLNKEMGSAVYVAYSATLKSGPTPPYTALMAMCGPQAALLAVQLCGAQEFDDLICSGSAGSPMG